MPVSAAPYRTSIVAGARREAPSITDWLLYHRAIGFDHVYLYCNDDDPVDLYGQVLPFLAGERPFVTFVHLPFQDQRYHMYVHCLRAHKDETKWVMFLDVDEFLCLRQLHDVNAFLDAVPKGWDSISLNRLMFGQSGLGERPPGRVLLDCTRREGALKHVCKTLTRTAAIDLGALQRRTEFWHHWDERMFPRMQSRNVVGDDMREVRADDEGRSYVAVETNARRIIEQAAIHRLATEDLQPGSAVEDTALAEFWRAYLARAQQTRVIPPAPGPNLALGKPADQSSVSDFTVGGTAAEQAANVVNGRPTGGAQCRTGDDPFPWWSVDLQQQARVGEIRIYNSVDSVENAQRLKNFFVELSSDGENWSMVYVKHDEALVGGVDGKPLIVTLDPPVRARHVKIALVEPGSLQLDQVEVYGEAGAPVDAVELPAPAVRRAAPPVVHVEPHGGFGNQMIQFLAAHAIASRVPGCVVSNVDLSRWNIVHPPVPADGRPTERVTPLDMRLDVEGLAERLRSGALGRVEIDSVVRHIGNFPAREQAAALLRSDPAEAEGFGPDHLVINLRGSEVYAAPRPDQTLIPAAFYEEVVLRTGLTPVFMGQVGANPYVDDLRRRFPDAEFLPSYGSKLDFEIIRRSRNIVVSVSTFSWLAAWLSDAEQIILPLSGFLNPFQAPEADLLPLRDPRYQFHLFPINYAVPAEDHDKVHRAMTGTWRQVTSSMLEEMRARRPRYGDATALVEAAFDEAFYLSRNTGVAEAVAARAFSSGYDHYRRFGWRESRDPFPFDRAWYARTYWLAAIEVGQGDFRDLHHHYLAIGRDRGYLPTPPPARPETWDERVQRAIAEAQEAEA